MDATEIENPSQESPGDATGRRGEDAASKVALDLRGLVEAHPAGTVLGALGVGYLLGGGLFTTTTRRLVSAGLRLGLELAVMPLFERELAGLAGDLGEALSKASSGGHVSSTPQ